MLKKMENKVGPGRTPALRRWNWGKCSTVTLVLQLTLLTFIELVEDGEKFRRIAKARQDFPQSITADSIKDLGQVYESCI